ncbi:hypothetical protein [Parasedimentitalea maritima]|uniref:Uncharacterized protein n=1 Tax=Parasedimentitalea maritima TaxID=2578117 RepID=A0A6A4RD91_9RHOB|nr:hypothetical protein [Zongyanglinia marina]KAE9624220.1 hypothetical protein GP644_23530 [Zongyanglinia marina]
MAQPRKTYVVLVPFPYRGHWTAKDQKLDLLPCEARQLLRAGRIGDQSTQAVKKPAAKKAD